MFNKIGCKLFCIDLFYVKSSNAVAMVMNCIDAIYLADGREVWIIGFYNVYQRCWYADKILFRWILHWSSQQSQWLKENYV